MWARPALLTCGHYLPIGRCRQQLKALTAIDVSTGFLAGVRGRAARRLEHKFLPHLRELLASAPVLHSDETTGRAAATLSYVHVACTEYLTLMHVGGRSSDDIDTGGVLTEFTGVLVRDGYAGYTHLPAVHAWCAAHLLRDLRSISDADPDNQLWALAMAGVLLDANRAATDAREKGADALDIATSAGIRNRYLGALDHGTDENRGHSSELATKARTLIGRFRRYEDMILRFATDLSVPFTNNEAERALRPVKVQQRTSGGCWRTVQGLADFAIVHSYLDTANKLGHRQTQCTPKTIHHRPLATTSTRPQLNSYITTTVAPSNSAIAVKTDCNPPFCRTTRPATRSYGRYRRRRITGRPVEEPISPDVGTVGAEETQKLRPILIWSPTSLPASTRPGRCAAGSPAPSPACRR